MKLAQTSRKPSHTAGRMLVVLAASLTGCSPEPEPAAERDAPQRVEANAAADSAAKEPAATPARQVLETRTGSAVFISDAFHGKKTASGEVYDRGQLVAAHPSYPLGTTVRVTNLGKGSAVEVRIIDRSASAKNAASPIIDVSRIAAERLGFLREGRGRVRVEVLEWGSQP